MAQIPSNIKTGRSALLVKKSIEAPRNKLRGISDC